MGTTGRARIALAGRALQRYGGDGLSRTADLKRLHADGVFGIVTPPSPGLYLLPREKPVAEKPEEKARAAAPDSREHGNTVSY